jgi:hypothetical protein
VCGVSPQSQASRIGPWSMTRRKWWRCRTHDQRQSLRARRAWIATREPSLVTPSRSNRSPCAKAATNPADQPAGATRPRLDSGHHVDCGAWMAAASADLRPESAPKNATATSRLLPSFGSKAAADHAVDSQTTTPRGNASQLTRPTSAKPTTTWQLVHNKISYQRYLQYRRSYPLDIGVLRCCV